MAPRESIFISLSPSLADIADAVEKIETIIAAKTLKKQLLYDMLLGFRLLEQSLQNKQSEAYKLVVIWLNLFLKIQLFISSANEDIRDKFEKIVPYAVTYMIGCLQHKAKGITSFHFQLLEMIHELLSNVRPAVLEKLATFETGVIACIWFPIDFVGDFNTQLMALRLLVMLLKCVDSTRLQNELDNIRCTDRPVMKDKLTAAIAVANFHAAKFENTARDLLNTYNMHLSQNILVYSFRCKTCKFGDSIEFFKPMNADNFWIDINYCPSTLTFSGRCQTNNQIGCATCSVILQIVKLSLNNQRLYVQFQAPAELINASSDFPDLTNITMTEIVLPRDEAMRLQENKFILKYYNKSRRPINTSVVKLHTTSTRIQFQSIEDAEKTVLNTNANLINDNLVTKSNEKDKNTVNMENKENVPPEEGHTTTTTQCTKSTASNMEAVSKQFQKSFDFLIGLSKEDKEEVHSKPLADNSNVSKNNATLNRKKNSKLPLLSNIKNPPNDKELENIYQSENASKIVDYSISASESRLSSQMSRVSPKEIVKKPQRRFFKILTSNSENECFPNKKKKNSRIRSTRNKRKAIATVSSKKSKQVNEVKPMLHSKIPSAANASNNRSINEIGAIFNVNICNTNTVDPTSSKMVTDEYENCLVSDAEPGRSYRNFKIRRKHKVDKENTLAETKRCRKTLPRAVKKDVPKELLLAANSQVSRKAKPIRKRALCMDPFDELKGQTVLPKKIGKSEKIAFNNKNQTICSMDMENIADAVLDAVLHSCSSYKRHQPVENSHARTFAIQEPSHILNDSLNLNEVSKTATQTFQDNISSNQVDDIEIRKMSSVSAEVAELGGDQVDEIQECRRDVGHNVEPAVHSCEEFSDCPTLLHLMDISDMLPSSECESTKIKNIPTKRASDNESKSHTEMKSTDDQTNKSNVLKPHSCIIYYSRSEDDSNSESECEQSLVSETNTLGSIAQPLELSQQVFVTPQLPLKNFQKTTSITKCHVTTTATSIITHQDHVIHHQEFVGNLAKASNMPLNLSKSCSRATTTTTTKTVVKENKQINLNSFIRRPMNITTPTPRALKQEVSNMISKYKANLNLQLEHMETDVNKNSANVYIKKICDVGERIMTEIERERKSLMELEVDAERLARQLCWQYEAYQKKTQQFECFKQNIDNLLRALSNVNLLEEIENDAQNKIQQLQQTSSSMTAQQWRSFINETTENLLKDLSSLTDL